jgi:hypothetical protein
MSRTRSSRRSSHASATCVAVAEWRAATRAIAGSAASLAGPPVNAEPSGKNGTNARSRSMHRSSTSSPSRSTML